MYEKNLTEDLRLRLSKTDMDFLRSLSDERQINVSECIRSIIGEYRRSLEGIKTLSKAIALIQAKDGGLSNGDTKTNLDDIV